MSALITDELTGYKAARGVFDGKRKERAILSPRYDTPRPERIVERSLDALPKKPFGTDVSKYNGPVDWAVGKENNVIYAGMRATISWGYVDTWLPHNLTGTREQGIYRLPYHVLYPGEPARSQAENFLRAVGDDWQYTHPVLDLELDHGKSKSEITGRLLEWCGIIKQETSLDVIIYSRAGWINEHTNPGVWRSNYYWWLADYLLDRTIEDPGPPALPNGVTTWLIHQTADKVPAPAGFPGVGGILTWDTNRWNGTERDVRRFFGDDTQPEPGRGTMEQWANAADEWMRTQGYDGIRPPKDEAQL